jgi:hypothetical protein
MPLTHDFNETIRARAQAEPEFRQALLRETIECIINGDLATGKAVLRDYVNATGRVSGFGKNVRTSRPKASCACWDRRAVHQRKPFQYLDRAAADGRCAVSGLYR